MAVYGYHRTSTQEQHLDRVVTAIKEYCIKNYMQLTEIFTDKQTGKNFNRPDYQALRRIAKNTGDIIILSELDRLGRNKVDTLNELQHYKSLGIRVMILEIPTTLIDYSSFGDDMATMLMQTVNNMLIEMYATLAHAEMQKREKRQREGIQAMKERGEWNKYGRPVAVDYDIFKLECEKVLSGEQRPFECIKKLSLSKSTYYRYREKYEKLMESKK